MIVLNVTYKCKPDMRASFLEAIRAEGIDTACRAEAGNLKYDYYFPAHDSGDLLLVEKWKDAQSLAAHGAQPHMARLRAFKEAYVTDTTIEKFEMPQD